MIRHIHPYYAVNSVEYGGHEDTIEARMLSVSNLEQYETETRVTWVRGAGGVRIYLKIRQPRRQKHVDKRFPAVIVVPGGVDSGAIDRLNYGLAALGYVQAGFVPQGRGDGTPEHPKSEGEEDFNGFAGQDGLKAAIEYVAMLPEVDSTNIGIMSSSFGISLSAGVLGRNPDLPVHYVLDAEGPSDSHLISFGAWNDPEREDYAFGVLGHRSTVRDPSPENVAWWSEREAVRYIGRMRACYLRIQSDEDHGQPAGFCQHALDLVNRATLGASPWTRVNGSDMGNPINVTYDMNDPATYPRLFHVPVAERHAIAVRYILEMTELVRRGEL